MGYTHYWYRGQHLDAKKFAAASSDCKRICDALGIPLGNGVGENEPEFSADAICFNGHVESKRLAPHLADYEGGLAWPSDDAQWVATVADNEPAARGRWCAGPLLKSRALPPDGDGSYETFVVERSMPDGSYESDPGQYFAFCKTNYRPYDLAVQCCLIVLDHHLGREAFRVESDGDDEQWNDARSACQHVLGYGLDFPSLDEAEAAA